MAASGKQMSLDQRTQKRNKDEDVPPFLCYDGANMNKQNPFDMRCWTGEGLVIYAGNGNLEVRGYGEPLPEEKIIALDGVIKKAYQYLYPDEEK